MEATEVISGTNVELDQVSLPSGYYSFAREVYSIACLLLSLFMKAYMNNQTQKVTDTSQHMR